MIFLFICGCSKPPVTPTLRALPNAPDPISDRLPRDFLLVAEFADSAVLRVTGERSQIVVTVQGGTLALLERLDGHDRRREVSIAPATQLAIAKTDDFIEIFLDHRQVLSGPATHQRWLSAGGSGLRNVHVQKTGSIVFSDDFMRAADAPSLWQVVRGEWRPQGVDNAVRNANPFSFLATGEDAMALTGQPFWRDYVMQCSLRPTGASMFGLLVNALDAENHYRVAWQDGILSLSSVRDGDTRELARSELALVDDRWYRVRVEILRGLISVDFDDQRRLQAYDPSYRPGGGIGLVASTVEKGGVTWDDISVASVENFSYDLEQASEKLAAEPLAIDGTATFHGFRRRNSWVVAQASGDCELRNRWYDDANFAFLRVRAGQAELGIRDHGQDHVLASTALADGSHALKLSARDALLAGSVNGEVLLVGKSPVATAAGLCQVASITATRLSAGSEDGPAPLNRVHPAFSHERSMSYWSHPGNDWKHRPSDIGHLFWHRGDFWAGLRVGVDLGKLRAEQGEVSGIGLVLAPADRSAVAEFARVVLSEVGGEIVLRRYEGEQAVESLPLGESAALKEIAIERLGQNLLLFANGELIWQGTLPESLRGLANIAIEGIAPTTLSKVSTKHKVDSAPEPPKWLDALSVAADHVHTESFHDAPVDWHIGAGTWEVTNRWQCDPRWHFFAGYNLKGASCLWYKRPHGENITLEFFAAPKMDRERGSAYQYAADLNAVICADGQDVSSGYSFLFGGHDNQGSYVKRGDSVIIENDAVSIPRASSIHHRWFYVKLRKAGSRISFWVDGDLVGSHDEVDGAIPDGFLGIWTWHNAIMVSQVRIATDGQAPARTFVYGEAAPAVPYASTQDD